MGGVTLSDTYFMETALFGIVVISAFSIDAIYCFRVIGWQIEALIYCQIVTRLPCSFFFFSRRDWGEGIIMQIKSKQIQKMLQTQIEQGDNERL